MSKRAKSKSQSKQQNPDKLGPYAVMGARFRESREAAGLTQAELARLVGMKQQGIGSIEAGKSGRPREIKKFAAALNRTEEWLLHGEGPPAANKPDIVSNTESRSESADVTPLMVPFNITPDVILKEVGWLVDLSAERVFHLLSLEEQVDTSGQRLARKTIPSDVFGNYVLKLFESILRANGKVPSITEIKNNIIKLPGRAARNGEERRSTEGR